MVSLSFVGGSPHNFLIPYLEVGDRRLRGKKGKREGKGEGGRREGTDRRLTVHNKILNLGHNKKSCCIRDYLRSQVSCINPHKHTCVWPVYDLFRETSPVPGTAVSWYGGGGHGAGTGRPLPVEIQLWDNGQRRGYWVWAESPTTSAGVRR